MQSLPIRRALLSVTDKSGIVEFASFLVENNVTLISTGGTKKALEKAHLPVTSVNDVTGFPEILGGRVKTLHPKIHGGILADLDNEEHCQTIDKHNIRPIDCICVNLYDFQSAVDSKVGLEEAIEQIDIGGPCMLRAAAKNFHSTLVIPDPKYYSTIMDQLKNNTMAVSLQLRLSMAQEVFKKTAEYDRLIAQHLTTFTIEGGVNP